MMGRTHLMLGLGSAWALAPFPGFEAHLPAALLGAALGSLLPDLDARNSLLQTVSVGGVRPFRLPALAVSPYGHRGLLHSLAGQILVAVLALPLAALDPFAWAGVIAGHASHVLADAATKGGVRLLYPDPRRFHALPRPLRLTTGSPPEEAVLALAAVCLLALLASRLGT